MKRGRGRERERMQSLAYVKLRRTDGRYNVYPLRYLAPDERRAFLARATTPL